jgi:uncharacterized membrane protein YagU involved in acid resistance
VILHYQDTIIAQQYLLTINNILEHLWLEEFSKLIGHLIFIDSVNTIKKIYIKDVKIKYRNNQLVNIIMLIQIQYRKCKKK